MSRFLFTIDDGRTPPDETIVDLLDVAEAKKEALRTAGEVLKDIGLGNVWDGVPWHMTVKDAAGVLVLELQFKIKGHSGN